ncbi:nitrate ABC transporter substrate-binding protein [Thiomicrospira aerophila AL3]|uniref:Nitrate ABC transporter substrate-binding protein n=1 Tax=Thiomicrospira aerophila AL3 TaxID=717772 RepID=W0DPH0_9GAMM|nr:ABC transporter substrate-binding protein [Thiomicrospira aerophila]AHF00505.1 nitrate ABC transporter substrate-binding protein [Thiomicrospira aerophila AL3]
MTIKSLTNAFDKKSSLLHVKNCTCPICQTEKSTNQPSASARQAHIEQQADQFKVTTHKTNTPAQFDSSEAMLDRAIENAVVRSVFNHNELSRRSFLSMVGAGTAAAAISSVFPLNEAKAAIKESLGPLEKSRLNIGFVPITCATPIIMAEPMGFYDKYGLSVNLEKTAGWAVARDKSLAREYDASHMLTPMPLAMTIGAGSTSRHFIMPAVENVNGQAIVLHNDHKDKRDPKQWKGFRFGVPFEYSMHNFLLRYYVAEHGLDPDQDIQIRVVPPPEMVANLRAGNLDGYLSPDPFNQRAVWENVGFIHMLTKDIWDKHPCCAFACSQEFATQNPNTYGALLRAIIDATHYSSIHENRREIASAIAPRNYLNQPVPVIEQVLTGRFADGLGNIQDVPDRIDFDPFPWHSMGVWILTQMKRWGYISGDIQYNNIAERVYLATETAEIMRELGQTPPSETYKTHTIMGKTFDPAEPEAYINSFAIGRKG